MYNSDTSSPGSPGDFAEVAQQVEQLICNQPVVSSSLILG